MLITYYLINGFSSTSSSANFIESLKKVSVNADIDPVHWISTSLRGCVYMSDQRGQAQTQRKC